MLSEPFCGCRILHKSTNNTPPLCTVPVYGNALHLEDTTAECRTTNHGGKLEVDYADGILFFEPRKARNTRKGGRVRRGYRVRAHWEGTGICLGLLVNFNHYWKLQYERIARKAPSFVCFVAFVVDSPTLQKSTTATYTAAPAQNGQWKGGSSPTTRRSGYAGMVSMIVSILRYQGTFRLSRTFEKNVRNVILGWR